MNKKGFTLVELIVVIALLSIVATIAAISFIGYLAGVRDANRITQINNIADGVALKLNDGEFLKPEGSIEIQESGKTYAYQGYFGDTLIDEIEFSMDGLDPKDNTHYTYTISSDGKYFQIMGLLEEEDSLEAIGYEGSIIETEDGRFPYIVGSKEIGVFLDDEAIPVHEYATSPLNIEDDDTDVYNVILQNDQIFSSSGDDLFTGIDNVVDNYADNIYGCASQPYSYANYVMGTPTESNTSRQNSNSDSPCYFACKTGYIRNGTNCEPTILSQDVYCSGLPDNADWNSAELITQYWDTSTESYLPTSEGEYNTSSSTTECRFDCDYGYEWDDTTQTCYIPTRVYTCDGKPSNSYWNTATEIDQTLSGSDRVPDETPFWTDTLSYDDQCAFSCDYNYEWDSDNETCDGITQPASCTDLPDNASWNTVSSITQIWGGSDWGPTTTGSYNIEPSTEDCYFTCNTNYTWDEVNSVCEPDVMIAECTGLPSNAYWDTNESVDQTWSGTEWLPSSIGYYDPIETSNACNFECNVEYTWNGSICEYDPADPFEETLVDICGIDEDDFDDNYNVYNGEYSGNIDCANKGLTDEDLLSFDGLKRVYGYFDLSGNSLTTLSGLDDLGQVTGEFRLNDNQLTDISALASSRAIPYVYLQNNNLTSLNHLDASDLSIIDASNNSISDISELASKRSVKEIYLSNNNITSLNGLDRKTSIEIIDVSDNDISDISTLANGLGGLRDIYLQNNNISDISVLSDSDLNLDIIYIYGNSAIDDLSAFDFYDNSSKILALDEKTYSVLIESDSEVCNSWTVKNESLGDIADINSVCQMSIEDSLKLCGIDYASYASKYNIYDGSYNGDIDCSNLGLDDSFLASFEGLRKVYGSLNLSGNNFTTLNGLDDLGEVTGDLILNDNQLTDISQLSGTWSLPAIYLQNNKLTSLDGIGATNVSILDVSNNELTDISLLSNRRHITELNLSNNNLTALDVFDWKSTIKIINAADNNISNIDSLANGLSSLNELYLENNNLSDISILSDSDLTLDVLHIYGNSSIDDLSVFDNYTHTSREIALDQRDYTTKISSLSEICDTWDIYDENLTILSNVSSICYETSGSFTDFEGDSLGDWEFYSGNNGNGSNYGWFYNTGYTPSSNTGPSAAYSGDTYLYVEGSRASNRYSVLSYDINDNSNYMDFYYHMYGNNMGRLGVFAINENGGRSTIYSLRGQQHNNYTSSWTNTGDITIPDGTVKLLIYYKVGRGYRSDFSIDDITVGEK